MQWPFAKYVACGNDFILFDNREENFPASPTLIRQLCHRHYGIGADGVLLLENSRQADYRMRIFNSDGSEAEMCGNGLRCFAKWLISLGFPLPPYRIELVKDVLIVSQIQEAICIEMGHLQHVEWNISLSFGDQLLLVHHLYVGVPHAILFVKDITSIDCVGLGMFIRHHPRWQPRGTNVTFVQQLTPQKIKIRTYERGVEGETLACGTGATAAALATAYHYSSNSPITVQTQSSEELTVDFSFHHQEFSQITLTGLAQQIFIGETTLHPDFVYSS